MLFIIIVVCALLSLSSFWMWYAMFPVSLDWPFLIFPFGFL